MKDQIGIIFDCDGTLVDSLGQAMESFNYALDQVGAPPRAPEVIKKYFGAAADRILTSVLGDEQKAKKAFEIYIDHQSELAKITKLHSGVRELIEKLDASHVPLAIVTGRHERDLEVLLKPHDLAKHFKVLVADSMLAKSKPEPDGILLACKKLNIEPRNAFYVGDSTTDIKAAHNAGSRSIAATWDSLATHRELEKAQPDFIAKIPMDVEAIYRKMLSPQ